MRPRVLGGVAILLLAAACGGSSYGSSAGGSGGGEATFAITSPQDGATVSSPFTIKVSSSEAIGAPESGKDHWHVYVDGNNEDYKVATASSLQMDGLSPGKHTIDASLQHADHSPVGVRDEITVTVKGGSSGTQGGGGDSGGGYHY